MMIVDWRELSADAGALLCASQVSRWREELDWDVTAHWADIEAARVVGASSGFAVLDRRGGVVGWTCFSLRGNVVHIGALEGQTRSGVIRLLDAIFRSPDAVRAQDVAFWGLQTPTLMSALTERRFTTQAFLYLQCYFDGRVPPVSCPETEPSLVPWRMDDGPDTVRTFQSVYAAAPERWCLAGEGKIPDWVEYLRGVIHSSACGYFFPAASFVARDLDGRSIGIVLTTRISSSCCHVAQLVVESSHQRRGVGAALLHAACDAARNAGFQQISLQVQSGNEPALSLYRRAGFVERARATFARRQRPIQRRLVA